jgi:serine/threonine protein kinase
MTEAWKSWEGQTVDGFPLRQYLGGSDHSAVYLTQLTSSGSQNAAIKFIAADASAEAQLARWRVAGQLSHPFLQPLIRVGRCQLNNTDFLYVVMEYAEENLAQILPQRALEPQEVRQVLDSLIQALIYLHGQGLAHTSIKPGNILASGDQLKISSDTLCEIGSAPLAMPRTSIYTAPEARSAPVSTAADVWSIGVTLVEMLTQRTPTIKNQTRAELPVPETIPPPFLAIARHCVQMDAGRRATLKEIEGLLNPASGPAAKRDPNLVAPNVQVTPADPVKKSLSAQQVSYAPHTLMPAKTTTPAATAEAPPRKRNVALPLVAAIVVFGAILVAPRVMNRFSPLRPQAATVEPTIAPASSVLDAPPISTSKIEPNKAIVDKSALRGSKRDSESPNGKPAGKNRSGRPQGSVLYQVVPDVSQRARDTILGKVRVNVKLKVDSGGSVSSAEEDNDNASRFFADQAVQVAKRWTFTPPEVDGHPVASEWLLRFEFTPTATKVFPTQTTP